jgi:hypothetical protein
MQPRITTPGPSVDFRYYQSEQRVYTIYNQSVALYPVAGEAYGADICARLVDHPFTISLSVNSIFERHCTISVLFA